MSVTRRMFAASLAATLATPALAATGSSTMSAYAFSFDALEGGTLPLAAYAGKPLLVVNTASLCGYTPQYTALEALWQRYRPRGLTIIGVPSNDFGGQEPGTAIDIAHVAHESYGVTFPLAAKAAVRGPDAHRFYKWAAQQRPGETPLWNFHKYLIGHDGNIAAVFSTGIDPGSPGVANAIEKELAIAGQG